MLTSVGGGVAILGDRRSIVGLMELTERGERSIERREEFCRGEGDDAESDSDLAPSPLLSLLTRGVATAAFFGVSADAAFLGVSDTVDLYVSRSNNNPLWYPQQNQIEFKSRWI